MAMIRPPIPKMTPRSPRRFENSRTAIPATARPEPPPRGGQDDRARMSF